MGLEELRLEIIEKANKQAESIEETANQEAAKILDETKSKIKEMQKALSLETEKTILNVERKGIAKANFEVKKQLLDKKQELINKVFEESKGQIIALSVDKNKQIFEKLLAKAVSEIEISTLYINKKDKAFVKNYSWLSADIIGGFMAENKEKTMRIDYSYDTLLDTVKNKTIGEVVKVLFN